MINKFKYLFLLVFVLGACGIAATVSAQTDGSRVVANAGGKLLKQSDVDTLIDFYEWAFELKFNETQRANFQRNTEAEFRGNPAGTRQTMDDIILTFPQILAADEDVRQKTRDAFVSEFIADARKQSDETSRLLVGLYDNRPRNDNNGGEDGSHGVGSGRLTGAEENSTGTGSLSALLGEWVWGRSGSMTTTTSGAYLGGNGSRHTYRFSAGGAVEYNGIMNVMTGGCRMQIFRSSRGKASLSGNTLTIRWSPASFSRDDSCSPAKNYKKTLPAETEVLQVKFKTDYGEKQLCLIGTDETCYSPAK